MDLEYGQKTVAQVRKLKRAGIDSMIVLMRHSAREFNRRVPDLQDPLTDDGREFAQQLGKSLPAADYRLYSSVALRCVDTANHIGKGLREMNARVTDNEIKQGMEFFYTKDGQKVFELIKQAGGYDQFLRQWFDGHLPEEAIQDANSSSQVIMTALKKQLAVGKDNTIDICVSHDWNLYLVKEKFMNITHENTDKVEFLDGLVLYENCGRTFVSNPETDPVEIS